MELVERLKRLGYTMDEATDMYLRYAWDDNIVELEKIIEEMENE